MGLIDGSLNNAHVADHSNILGVMVNSKINDEANSNANTRARGRAGSNTIDDQDETEDTPVSER